MAKIDTCLTIVSALNEQMKSTQIDRVKVTDLCKDACVSRATFYENFQDVYAVATWMWDHLMKTTLYQAGITLNCFDAHLAKFRALREHGEFFRHAMRIVEYNSICQYGGRRMFDHCEAIFERKAGRQFNAQENLQFEFYNTGAKHMTRHWVERGMAETPEDMAQLFTSNMPAFIVPYLEPDPA